MQTLIEKFAELVEKQQIERLQKDNLGCNVNLFNAHTKVIKGNKYTKVNIGSSGKYMVDKEGSIYGIKAYGVVNKGRCYGTLETVHNYYWGDYTAYKI